MASRSRRVAGLAAGAATILLIPLLPLTAEAADQPSAVAVAGDLDSEFGCGGDWAPDCDQAQMTRRADDVWQLTADLPAGPFAYKAALDKAWDVNYGLNAAPGGANIPITVPAGGAKVSFFYDHGTHWITDTLTAPIATAAGDFQSELGCPSDWSPDCLRTWLQDPDGDDTYTFTTTVLPAGTYQVKATLGMSWDVNYGQDGVQGGDNIAFTVPADATTTTFSYDAPSHSLTVYAGEARPSLQAARAHWLTPGAIAWKLTGDPATRTYQLGGAPGGGLRAGPSGLTGGATIPLTYDPAGMPADLKAKYPHLATYSVLRVPARTDVAALLRGQVAVAAIDADGSLADASSLQIPGVLDTLFAAKARRATLGPTYRAGRPALSLWAPTAQTASVELYDSPTATTPALMPMRRDDATGVWSVTGDRNWDRKFYRYRIKVFAPAAMEVVTNSVTDPYSLALSTDSELSQIVDLDDRDLIPRGWNAPRLPDIANTRQQIQELHIGDFSTEDTTVPAASRGSYLAFTDTDSAGMRHLRELARSGVTTVHLLPTFDFGGVPENPADRDQPPCDLTSYPADSDQQQACIARTQGSDDFNWGYNPLHYTVPEGSYATRPTGAARTRQFREMVQALHRAGLRVVLDVVYNHTAAAGQDPDSVLDRIVPGYYQRLSLNGTVTTDSCCADTAPEHTMMNKLVVDSVKTWAEQYQIDGFRFDLMGLDP
ncbi:pullulanase X25 domain-containing protein, partial [Winogradskya humida]